MRRTVEFYDGGEISFTHERVLANNMRNCHAHQAYELYFLTEGERYLYAEGGFYKLRAGDIFIASPGIMHRTLDASGGYSKFVVMLPKSFVPKSFSEPVRIVRMSQSELSSAVREIADAERCESDHLWLVIVMRLLSSVLSLPRCGEPAVESPSLGRISEILDYLETNFTEKISLTHLSERFYISEYYLCRLFKEYTGRTLGEYLSSLRVERAKLLLSEGMPISRVWRESGFGSESSFTRVFRESCGVSAREWRNKEL